MFDVNANPKMRIEWKDIDEMQERHTETTIRFMFKRYTDEKGEYSTMGTTTVQMDEVSISRRQ
jgi:hypothetical protein